MTSGRIVRINAPLRLGSVRGFAIVAMPAVIAGLTLSGCGGGGGGGGGGTTTTPAPPSPPVSPPSPPVSPPSPPVSPPSPPVSPPSPPVSPPSPPVSPPSPPVSPPSPPSTPLLPAGTYPTAASSEYNFRYTLAQMNAATAFKYANGAGITVAVIDDGVSHQASELAGRISSASTDLSSSRNLPDGDPWPTTGQNINLPNHGTLISDIMAADFNGTGGVGVAYQATVLGIRADRAGCVETPTSGCFFDSDLVTGINYAIAHGAKVINLSLGGDFPNSTAFQNALLAAVQAGIVVTIAAGNAPSGTTPPPDPAYPARYATDPRFTAAGVTGAIIAVGATDASGAMASFSYLAGVAANEYIVAPGASLNTVYKPDASHFWVINGTSFSAPEVAGAIALLLQAFPNLTGRQAADILLQTATDLGAPGTDFTFGRGLLNLAAAFGPVGGLVVQSGGASVSLAANALAAGIGSAAFGDALASAPLATVGYDFYQREFRVDIGQAFPAGRSPVLGEAQGPTPSTTTIRSGLGGGVLGLSAMTSRARPNEALDRTGLVSAGASRAVLAQASFGRYRFSGWSGAGGAPAPALEGPNDAFQTLAASDGLLSAAVTAGGWSFSAERGTAGPTGVLQFDRRPGSDYVSFGAFKQVAGAQFKLGLGRLNEPRGVLGADAPADSAYRLPARTDFASVFVQTGLAHGLSLSGQAAFGDSRAQGPLLSLENGVTSSWRIALDGACGRFACDQFTLFAAQPLRLEHGLFTAALAQVPDVYGGETSITQRRFTASPSGREIDLGANLVGKRGKWGQGEVSATLALQPGSIETAPPAYGLSATWRSPF